MRKAIYVVLFFWCCASTVEAQIFGDLFEDSSDSSVVKKDKSGGVFVLPLLYYTPDTRLAYGAFGVYYFRLKSKDPLAEVDKTRLSYAKLLVDYTQNKQLDIWGSYNIFLREEAWLLKGEARYRNFPDRYYGVGNTTPEEAMERYSYSLFNFKILGMKKVREQMFVGLDFQYANEYGFELDQEGQLTLGEVTGYNGGVGVGVGGVFTWDTRDNVVNAHEGFLLEFSTFFDDAVFGSDFDFINLNATYNRYFELKENHILATNLVGVFNFGDVPFLDMAKAGGDDILRGYARNRYRDNNLVAFQTEYRFPVWWRFGATVFAGAGDVFRQPEDVSWKTVKYSYGVGFRFTVNKSERLNVRIDYGRGRQSDAFYIMLTEAF